MNYENITKCLKVPTVSPDTRRETATPLTDGCNNNRMVNIQRQITRLIVVVYDYPVVPLPVTLSDP